MLPTTAPLNRLGSSSVHILVPITVLACRQVNTGCSTAEVYCLEAADPAANRSNSSNLRVDSCIKDSSIVGLTCGMFALATCVSPPPFTNTPASVIPHPHLHPFHRPLGLSGS